MRFAIICFIWVMCPIPGMTQKYLQQKITNGIDSILQNIAIEKDEKKLVDLIISIHQLKFQAFPNIYLETGQKMGRIAQQNGSTLLESVTWSLLGQGYRLSGNYIKGLECHHKAVALAEKTGNEAIIALTTNEKAHIYKDREENDIALKLYLTAMDHALKSDLPELSVWPSMNLGAIYLVMDKPDSSIFYTQNAIQINAKRNMGASPAYLNLNLAGAYSMKYDNARAKEYFRLASTEAIRDSSSRYQNLINVGLAEHYLRNEQIDSSIYYARKAIEVVQHTPFIFLSIKPAKMLTDIFENRSADSTVKYLKIYRAANDSIFNSRATQQLQMMTFEEDQRQAELAIAKREYRNKIRTYFLLGALGLFSIAAIILMRNNKQKQKANAMLIQQKEELQSTVHQLKNTQAQLIQSEKMASLGELTAGIAHEIQNPLNFVNNFADVNSELIAEMKHELDSGKIDDAKVIANNIDENEQKIIFHGKRADAIVKGMLMHSRTNSGTKEPTDINVLVDEYLRLAYHGLRAKDKSFNTTIKTELDESIGLINVIPQEMGRVILNLITNAFYAVDEKKKHSENGYEPMITITTNKLADKINLLVKDNGNGIPLSALDKIFHPFFTTKPAGQGTGLGLSLSYDIVKAHGGELKVNTKEGEGTEFIIQLPITL